MSETNAKQFATIADNAKTIAVGAANQAVESETNAKASENASKISEDNAKISETNAKASEDNAVSASSEAVKSANEAKKIAADLSKNIGIDDANESYASTWSSAKIKSEFDKTSDAVPTKVSELQNDENYQNANDVKSAIAAEIAKIVADAPEDFDTLKEMSDWIASHVNDASAMNSAISKNTEDISKLASDKVSSSGDVSDTIVNFDESTEDDTLTPGEPLKSLIGKIKKVLDSVKTTLKGLASIAKTGSARDLSDVEALNIPTLTNNLLATTEGTALDATQGKLMKDNIDSLKSGLANFKFKNNSGKAQYSMDGGTSWVNFRNPVGTAAAADVLAGKTFANTSSDSVAGTMTNRGAWTSSPTASGKVTIPAGYHNGSGYVNTAGVYATGYNAGKASASVDLTKVALNKDKVYNSKFNYDYTWISNETVRLELEDLIVQQIYLKISGGTLTCTIDPTHYSTDEILEIALK